MLFPHKLDWDWRSWGQELRFFSMSNDNSDGEEVISFWYLLRLRKWSSCMVRFGGRGGWIIPCTAFGNPVISHEFSKPPRVASQALEHVWHDWSGLEIDVSRHLWKYCSTSAHDAFGCFWKLLANRVKQNQARDIQINHICTLNPLSMLRCRYRVNLLMKLWFLSSPWSRNKLIRFNMECEKDGLDFYEEKGNHVQVPRRTSGVSCTRSNPCPSIKRDLGFRLPVEFKQQPIGPH